MSYHISKAVLSLLSLLSKPRLLLTLSLQLENRVMIKMCSLGHETYIQGLLSNEEWCHQAKNFLEKFLTLRHFQTCLEKVLIRYEGGSIQIFLIGFLFIWCPCLVVRCNLSVAVCDSVHMCWFSEFCSNLLLFVLTDGKNGK